MSEKPKKPVASARSDGHVHSPVTHGQAASPLAHGDGRHNGHGHHDGALHHETTDVRVRPLVIAGVGVVVISVLSFVLMWALMAGWQATWAPGTTSTGPESVVDVPTPPAPRLQAAPVENGDAIIATQEARMNSYGRDANGVVHIPIERAKELLYTRGLPTITTQGGGSTPATTPTPSSGTQP